MKKVCCIVLCIAMALSSVVFASESYAPKTIIINKIMPANADYLIDANGEFSDLG